MILGIANDISPELLIQIGILNEKMILTWIFGTSDTSSRDLLRMEICLFQRLCAWFRIYRLVDSKYVRIEEQEAIPSSMINVIELDILLSFDLDR